MNNPLYQFGSSILGYDVYHQKSITPQENNIFNHIRPYVGEGSQYGFHATIADAMYFSTQADIERIKAELSILVEDLPAFTLSNLQIKDRTDEGDMVVLCDDQSGVTEVLHHELVSRFYRLAISSTYVARTTTKRIPSNNQKRSELMISRYGAPYIFNEFNLHFTLCSSPPTDSDTRNKLFDDLENEFKEKVKTDKLLVDKIHLLLKNKEDNRWKIEKTYQLKK